MTSTAGLSAQNLGRFDGRAVIVTGASSGLGRAYAFELASLGASIVIHGRNSAEVEATRLGVLDRGGQAVACLADTRDGEALVQASLNSFGRVDAVLVNAGVARDRSFAKMSAEEWTEVLQVHLEGAYLAAKAVWPHMVKAQYGRIVLTTSGAGFHGNFGQANYSAAKAGIVGLAKTLALEGRKYGILVNVLAPMGVTPMSGHVLDEQCQETLFPKRVAPYAAALCHESLTETSMVIEAGGGWASAMRWQRSAGISIPDERLTVANVLANWSKLTNFSEGSDFPVSIQDSLSAAVLGAHHRRGEPL